MVCGTNNLTAIGKGNFVRRLIDLPFVLHYSAGITMESTLFLHAIYFITYLHIFDSTDCPVIHQDWSVRRQAIPAVVSASPTVGIEPCGVIAPPFLVAFDRIKKALELFRHRENCAVSTDYDAIITIFGIKVKFYMIFIKDFVKKTAILAVFGSRWEIIQPLWDN